MERAATHIDDNINAHDDVDGNEIHDQSESCFHSTLHGSLFSTDIALTEHGVPSHPGGGESGLLRFRNEQASRRARIIKI